MTVAQPSMVFVGDDEDTCNALDKAGLKGYRWHDIRHTWATHHVMNGTPLHTLQHLGGWSDFNIVNRYAHLSKDYLTNACETTNDLVS